jgi:hypothetical protein
MLISPISNHVRVFENVLTPDHCKALIDRFEASPDQETYEREGGHSFVQVNVTRDWPDQNEVLLPIFMSWFNAYGVAVNARFWPPKVSYENLRVKRYLPNGRDCFPLHVDVMCHEAARRFMTAFIYLNAPEEGETVFPTLGLTIAPQAGRMIAFPPLWLFPHEGRPPRSGPKYILHTYLCYPAEAPAP